MQSALSQCAASADFAGRLLDEWKPAPLAPTTTMWSMNLYARVELVLFLGGLGLDADLQNGVDAGDCGDCRNEIVQCQQDHCECSLLRMTRIRMRICLFPDRTSNSIRIATNALSR